MSEDKLPPILMSLNGSESQIARGDRASGADDLGMRLKASFPDEVNEEEKVDQASKLTEPALRHVIRAVFVDLIRINRRLRQARKSEYECLAELAKYAIALAENRLVWLAFCHAALSFYRKYKIVGRPPKPQDQNRALGYLNVIANRATSRAEALRYQRDARGVQVLIDDGVPPEQIAQALKENGGPQKLAAKAAVRRREAKEEAKGTGSTGRQNQAGVPAEARGQDHTVPTTRGPVVSILKATDVDGATRLIEHDPAAQTFIVKFQLISGEIDSATKLPPGQYQIIQFERCLNATWHLRWLCSFEVRVISIEPSNVGGAP